MSSEARSIEALPQENSRAPVHCLRFVAVALWLAMASSQDVAAMSRLVKDLWGQLPRRDRDQMLQPLNEQFVPEYADEIEE